MACAIMLCLSQQAIAQMKGIPFTATYKVAVEKTHVLEKDSEGNVIKSMSVVTGTGTHSILGDVTTIAIVHTDLSVGDNVFEFTVTDADGNSLFMETKGISLVNNNWECYSAILGGTGKFKTATGYLKATGTTTGLSSTSETEGMLYYTSLDEEKDAIKKVIAAETQAYIDKDMTAMDNAYLIAPFTTNVGNVPQGTIKMIHRYKDGKAPIRTKEELDAVLPISNIERYNWNIQVRGDVAWAAFDQKLDVVGSRVSSIETRFLEKLNGQWKIVYSNTLADLENAKPPLALQQSNRIYAIHEIELKPGVNPTEFESFINDTVAPIYNNFAGQEFILTKADRGERKGKYSIVLVVNSLADRDRIYPANGKYDTQDWGPDETWVKLNTLCSGLGTPATPYSDYIELK